MTVKYLNSLWEKAELDQRRHIYELVERNTDAVFLDCGCDTGEFTMEVAKKIGTKQVFGIDVVARSLEEAGKRGIITKVADLNKTFPFEGDAVDAILANQVIEHLVDIDNFLHEVARLLKPDGYAIISTENLSSWHNIFALLLGFQPFSSANLSTKRTIGNPFALHRGKPVEKPASFQHNRVLAYQALLDFFGVYNLAVEKILGSGYYPFPSVFSKALCALDKRHAAFLTVKVRRQRG